MGIEIKTRREKENERKKRRKERKSSMPERNKEKKKRMILVTVRTAMILVKKRIRSSVYLMSLFLMKTIRFISQCMIRLRREDLVYWRRRRRKLGNRKKLSTSLQNLKLRGPREKRRKGLLVVTMRQ